MSIHPARVTKIIQSKKFRDLVRNKSRISLTLTFVILTVYFGFILSIAFYGHFFEIKIGEYLTLGIPVGIGIIIFAWFLTGIYAWWANNKYDKKVDELRNQILNQKIDLER